MIKPGIGLCNGCGKTFEGFYYVSGQNTTDKAQLVWSDEYDDFRLTPLEGQTVFALNQKILMDQENFPPEEITVRINTDENLTTLKRCCRHCGKVLDSNLIGLVPGYVIGVMGATRAGKTSWLGALATAALSPLVHQKYPYTLIPDRFTAPLDGIGATLVGIQDAKNNNTNYFKVIHRKTGEVAALVYLFDYGGELYKDKSYENDNEVRRLLSPKNNRDYPGIDALVVIEPAVYNHKIKQESSELVPVIDKIKGINNEKLPIAHVMTHGDLLLERESAKTGGDSHPPLLTAKTFPATAYTNQSIRALGRHFTPEAIADRFHLQNYIACKAMEDHVLGRHLQGFHDSQTRHFLVRSCQPVKNEKGDEDNDYTKQFNVVDPLVWLLHKLNLFPLVLENGG